MATYEIIRETHGEATCLATTLGGQRWWITRTAVAKAAPRLVTTARAPRGASRQWVSRLANIMLAPTSSL